MPTVEPRLILDQITAPILPHIQKFEKRLQQALHSDVPFVEAMAEHILKSRGNRFRPSLAFLTAQAVGTCSDRVIDAAVGIELIHTASLIHDDVIDSADTRRGTEVLHVQWGNRAAILMGDFLLAKALQILVGLRSMEVMDAALRATQWLIEGEILEGKSGSEGEISIYFNMINKKTASLMALACEVGAILGQGTPEQIVQMHTFGNEFGLAFQITDDLLDFIGNENTLGKPIGNDVREKKITLPLIRAMDNCQNGEAKKIHVKVRNGVKTEEDWQEILSFVHRYRGVETAREEAQAYAKSALKYLDGIQRSEAREALTLAAQHVVRRER